MEPTLVHKVFLGTPFSEPHEKLYSNYPRYRGFSGTERSQTKFEATFIVALTQAMGENGKFNRSYLFVPAPLVTWTNEQMATIAKEMFTRLKGRDTPEKRRKVCEHLGAALKHLLVGSRVLTMEAAPAHWTAFGFQPSDPVPEWLPGALLLV